MILKAYLSYDWLMTGEGMDAPLSQFAYQWCSVVEQVNGQSLFVGSDCDPCSPENIGNLKVMLDVMNQFTILPDRMVIYTRRKEIVDLLFYLGKLKNRVRVDIPIETDSEETLQEFIPGSPSLEERWDLLKSLDFLGIPVGIALDPILPFTKSSEAIRKWVTKAKQVSTLQRVTMSIPDTEMIRQVESKSLRGKMALPEHDWFYRKGGATHLGKHLRAGIGERFAPHRRVIDG